MLKGSTRTSYITFTFAGDAFEVSNTYFYSGKVVDNGTVILTVNEAREEWHKWVKRGYTPVNRMVYPKERLRRKKQRVKTAMTDFDKLKKPNYALEA